MAETSRSRPIAAPLQEIWDVLADFGALSSWAQRVDHSCVLNHGPDGEPLGTIRRVQMGRNAVVERITEFDPPVALSYDIEGLPTRLGRLANRWTLRPTAGGTEVTVTSSVDIGSGPLPGVAEQIVGRVVARQSDSMLTGLARRLEKKS